MAHQFHSPSRQLEKAQGQVDQQLSALMAAMKIFTFSANEKLATAAKRQLADAAIKKEDYIF